MTNSHNALNQALAYVSTVKKVSRNPLMPIGGLFASGKPNADLLECIYRSEGSWPDQRASPFRHMLAVRNSVMIRLENILTFRPKNMAGLLYRPDNKGQIRKRDGVWEVEIPYDQFKNWKNCRLFGPTTSRRNFFRQLDEHADLYDLLDFYFLDIRNEFQPEEGCPYAFMTKGGMQTRVHDLNDIVGKFARLNVAWNPVLETGVPGVTSMNTYSFRHIKASDILQNSNAANKVEEAAFALQTSEPMIIDHYGLLLPQHALQSSIETFNSGSNVALERLAASGFTLGIRRLIR